MSKYNITGTGIYEFYLVLNPMMGNTESQQKFGPFPTKQAALDFYNAEKVELYTEEGRDYFSDRTDKKYYKTFKKGGPLEWCNPLTEGELEEPGYFGHGIHEVLQRVENVMKNYQIS